MTPFETHWQSALNVLRPSAKDLEHGLELHRNSFVFDSYGFMPLGGGDFPRMDQLLAANASREEVHYAYEEFTMNSCFYNEEMQKKLAEAWEFSGVDCIFQNCGEESNDIETLIQRLSSYTAVTDRLDLYERAVFPDQLPGIRERGKKSLYITTNGVPLPSKIASVPEALMYLQVFFNLGVRMMHMTYNRRNLIGDGCAEAANGGLSGLGVEVVKEMNKVGIIPDVAHSGQRTSLETALCSEKPVVASHSVAGKLSTHYRAKCDEVIEAIKKTNGYIGICAHPPFLEGKRNINTLIDHVDYVARTFGVDHVAIGTDHSTPLASIVYETKAPGRRPILENYWTGVGSYNGFTAEDYYNVAWTNWPLFTVGLVMR